ncbi:MAG: aldo/keto reductase [Abitibacteriaceae bacterium]|nr:aldo/keto reductase [Abditibacteriaceae bacterium]
MSDKTSTVTQLTQQAIGGDGPLVSRIALGCMGMTGTWNPADVGPENIKRAVTAFEAALDAGITLYDHADIYGGGSCESAFKDCLKAVPGAREKIYIATKCGIRSGHYNLTYNYIHEALDRSLERMGVEYVDLYQMHRPDPLTHPAETARALNEIVRQGKVRYIGVSNYYPEQIRALQRYLDMPIRSNQISISLRRLQPIYEGTEGMGGDGNLDLCMAMNMTPLAYSPLGGGWLSGRREVKDDARLEGLLKELNAQGEKYNASPGQMAVAWLLAHPAGIIPLVGSSNPEHIREAAGADKIKFDREDWYKLWVAARGQRVP